MNKNPHNIYQALKAQGLSPEQERIIQQELEYSGTHVMPNETTQPENNLPLVVQQNIYEPRDFSKIQNVFSVPNYVYVSKSLDEMLRRDERRKEDGFPKKIKLGKVAKPSKHGENKIVVVPSVVEEKLLHDPRPLTGEQETGGTGDGDEGEIIGEEPIHNTGEGDGTGSGQGGETGHEIESTAYDLGKILTEEFHLPNIKDKGKKRALSKYTYELTDRNRGFGQVLDKKATLKKIIETNLALGSIQDYHNINPQGLLVSPTDKIYRILSREKDYESQAVVFFVRDYSGSMHGKPTDLVVSQHLLVYTWLMYQFENNVQTRFILHDTDAKEVKDFYTYYNTSVAGGTKIAAAYQLVNKIVEEENLAADYNIYVFQGTDGEDWDTDGKDAINELKKVLTYVSRIGITIAQSYYKSAVETVVEKYLKKSGLLEQKDLIRMDSISSEAEQERLIEGIKTLVS